MTPGTAPDRQLVEALNRVAAAAASNPVLNFIGCSPLDPRLAAAACSFRLDAGERSVPLRAYVIRPRALRSSPVWAGDVRRRDPR